MGLISRVSSRTYRFTTKMADFARALQSQNIWFQAAAYRDAEIKLVQHRMGIVAGGDSAAIKPVAKAPASPKDESKAREMLNDLKRELTSDSNAAIGDINGMLARVLKLEQENNEIKDQLKAALARLDQLEGAGAAAPAGAAPAKPAAKEESEEEEEDDDMDFFGSDDDEEEDAAAEALKAKGVAAAKSMITIDVKPFDDETDLEVLAKKIKSEITMDGLVWGAQHKLVPLAFGIKKLVITAIVEDDKVSTDDLTEKTEEYEDEVQSTDIAAFNKL